MNVAAGESFACCPGTLGQRHLPLSPTHLFALRLLQSRSWASIVNASQTTGVSVSLFGQDRTQTSYSLRASLGFCPPGPVGGLWDAADRTWGRPCPCQLVRVGKTMSPPVLSLIPKVERVLVWEHRGPRSLLSAAGLRGLHTEAGAPALQPDHLGFKPDHQGSTTRWLCDLGQVTSSL